MPKSFPRIILFHTRFLSREDRESRASMNHVSTSHHRRRPSSAASAHILGHDIHPSVFVSIFRCSRTFVRAQESSRVHAQTHATGFLQLERCRERTVARSRYTCIAVSL